MSEQFITTPSVFGENGNFLLERELGTGGMGGVYMGRDKMLDRPVAVKVMLKEYGDDAEFVEKFKKEAQAAAKLIHPNIAQIYSYGICEGMPYIAMELVAGGSLYTIMQNAMGKSDIPRVLKICQQVAQALQCASDQGLVHGDVKPENILLDAAGNAKLVDFGLAAMQKDTDEIWGTPYYIAPEKVRKEPIDFRADMYSLGGTLYHALTGVAPFEGEDSIAVVKKRFEGAPVKPSVLRAEITPAIDKLVMTMLALNKGDRYPSFEALLEAFRDVLTNGLNAKSHEGTSATGAHRTVAVHGRRVVMKRGATIKRKLEADATSADATKVDDLPKPDEEDEDEGGGHLGLKVALFVIGGLLLIGGVIGGLVWFKVSSEAAEKAAVQEQIGAGYSKAKDAIADTVKKAKEFADEFDAFAQKAITECDKPTDELYKILPVEIAKMLKPASSKELDAAIAEASGKPITPPAPEAKPAATNAPAAKPATTNAPTAKAAPAKDAKTAPTKDAKTPAKDAKATPKDAKAAAKDAKTAPAKDAKPAAPAAEAEPPPQVVITMNELWERAYGCKACAIKIRQMSKKIVEKGAEAEPIKEVTRENMDKLVELSRQLVEMLDQMKTSKEVETVRKGITYIKTKGEKTVEQTIKRLRIEKLEKERKAKSEAAAAAEKARLEKLNAEKKAKIEAETKEIDEKFASITEQGAFRQLDWKNAIRQLETAKSDLETAEGQLAADMQIRKVNAMKKLQDVFIKNLNGHVFRGKLKGCKVTGVNDRDVQLVKSDGKTKLKISWQKFYKDYPGNLNEIINTYVVGGKDGRQSAKAHLSLRDWSEAMAGAALTMQLICAEVNGATERAEVLAKMAAKEFPEFLPVAQAMFPEIKFEAAEE